MDIYNFLLPKYKKYNVELFLRGEEVDYKGRFLNDILNFSDKELEDCHDYIQCIFPTDNISKFNKTVIISKEKAAKLAKDEIIIDNMKKSFNRMLKFYKNNNHWIKSNNHNLMRITRILHSLEMFGLEEEIREFKIFLKEIHDKNKNVFTTKTISLWKI